MTDLMAQALGVRQNPDLARSLAEIDGAREGYEAAREYDSINLWEQYAGTREGRTLRQAGIEYDPNFCAPVINAVSDGLVIESITAVPDGTDPAEVDEDAEQGTQLVNEIWHSAELDQYWPDWQRDSLRDGDGYIMVWPRADAPDVGVYLPEDLDITYVDPTMGRMFYDPGNQRRKLFFAQGPWCVKAEDGQKMVWRINLIYEDRIERYATPPMGQNERLDAKKFQPFEDDLADEFEDQTEEDSASAWPTPNPYGVIPVWHCRTRTPYGEPLHANAFAPQDALSDLIAELMVTVKFQGWPQAWALQEADNLGTQQIREDPLAESYPGDIDDFDDERVSLTQLPDGAEVSNETGTGLEATPGGMMIFKKFKAVGQFVSAQPGVFLDPWREFAKTVADTTGTPPWTFRAIGGEIPSGVALKIASQPQTSKRSKCALLFGAALRGALGFAAELCGMSDLIVTIKWAPFETVDEKERWELVELRTRAGVPFENALMMAGIPARQAAEWAKEREERSAQEFQRQAELASKAKPGNNPPVDE